jgi:hypothetical protein
MERAGMLAVAFAFPSLLVFLVSPDSVSDAIGAFVFFFAMFALVPLCLCWE